VSDKPVPTIGERALPYWEGTARGELRVQRCAACGERFLYAHALCPHCWTPDPGWETVSGRGRIQTMTIVHQAPYESFAGDVPYVVAIVRLDEGPQMMANIVDCDSMSVSIGQPVEVKFEMRGTVALPQFRPIG